MTYQSWGTPFFVSVVDANGVGWANGPIHSGQGDPSCLSITSDQRQVTFTDEIAGSTDRHRISETFSGKMKTVAPVVAIGSGVGGLVLGLVVGALTAIAYFWWKRRRDDRPDTAGKVARMDVGESPHRPFYRDLPSDNTRDGYVLLQGRHSLDPHLLAIDRLMRDTGYHIEPFTASDVGVRSSVVPAVSPDDSETVISKSGYDNISQLGDGTRSPTGRSHRGRSNPSVTIPTIPPPSSIVSDSISPRQSQAGGSQHVYVVHHDGGRAPVTVYTSEGTEVVELPPRYPAESGSPPQAEAPPASDITSNTSGSGDGSAIGPRAGVRPLPRPWEQTRQSGPTPTKVGNPTISFSS